MWKGDVLDRVEVRAGPPDPPGPTQVGSSGDRHYKIGESYLFVLRDRASPFRDDNCSATTVWGPRLAQYDPTPAVLSAINPVHPRRIDGGITARTATRLFVIALSLLVLILALMRNVND